LKGTISELENELVFYKEKLADNNMYTDGDNLRVEEELERSQKKKESLIHRDFRDRDRDRDNS